MVIKITRIKAYPDSIFTSNIISSEQDSVLQIGGQKYDLGHVIFETSESTIYK